MPWVTNSSCCQAVVFRKGAHTLEAGQQSWYRRKILELSLIRVRTSSRLSHPLLPNAIPLSIQDKEAAPNGPAQRSSRRSCWRGK